MSAAQKSYFTSYDMPYGMTYGSWTVEWWRWILAIPKSINPVVDTTGEYTYINQKNSDVFFLAGKLAEEEGDLPKRTCIISAEKSILIPVINCESNALEHPELQTEEEIVCRAKNDEDTITNAECYIDGENIPIQRISSDPIVFEVSMVKDNLFDVAKGGETRASADGFWVFLKPLSKGEHNITFRGSCERGRLHSGAIYKINVQ